MVPELPPFHAWEKPIQNRDEMGVGIRLLWARAVQSVAESPKSAEELTSCKKHC